MLNMLETRDFTDRRFTPVDRAHFIIESMKLAFADRAYWLGDPDFVSVPRGADPQGLRAGAGGKDRLDAGRDGRHPRHAGGRRDRCLSQTHDPCLDGRRGGQLGRADGDDQHAFWLQGGHPRHGGGDEQRDGRFFGATRRDELFRTGWRGSQRHRARQATVVEHESGDCPEERAADTGGRRGGRADHHQPDIIEHRQRIGFGNGRANGARPAEISRPMEAGRSIDGTRIGPRDWWRPLRNGAIGCGRSRFWERRRRSGWRPMARRC